MFVRPACHGRFESGMAHGHRAGGGNDPADVLTVAIPQLHAKVHVCDVVQVGIRQLPEQPVDALAELAVSAFKAPRFGAQSLQQAQRIKLAILIGRDLTHCEHLVNKWARRVNASGGEYVWPRAFCERLFGNQNPTEIRLERAGAEFQGVLECGADHPMLVATYAKDGDRVSEIMRWGLVPWWAEDIKVGYSTFNARADSVATKPAFRDAWKRGQRYLVVTDGFYEWRKSDKQPFAIGMADDGLMVMAGLWDRWKSPQGEKIKSCTVITCDPNQAVGAPHNRMPVILAEKDWPRWLGEEPASEEELKALLVACPSEDLKLWGGG